MRRARTGRLPGVFDRGVLVLRLCIILTTGLTLSACSTGVTESLRAADAAASTAHCRTTPHPGGGSTMDCTLWQRTTTTTTTTRPNGETTTTVERTRAGGDT